MEREVEVGQPEGLHARPAAEFVRLASKFQARVRVRYRDREADARSIISVLSLGASQGARVILSAEGEEAEAALEALAGFLAG